MRLPSALYAATILAMSAGPVFAFNGCDRASGEANISCLAAKSVPNEVAQCRAIPGTDNIACGAVKKEFDKINAVDAPFAEQTK